jgi:hypothetical protein
LASIGGKIEGKTSMKLLLQSGRGGEGTADIGFPVDGFLYACIYTGRCRRVVVISIYQSDTPCCAMVSVKDGYLSEQRSEARDDGPMEIVPRIACKREKVFE